MSVVISIKLFPIKNNFMITLSLSIVREIRQLTCVQTPINLITFFI